MRRRTSGAFDLDFAHDAAAGTLPAYSSIEPRYFTDILFGRMPNDQHPPHGVASGEALIAAVYNAVRSGPGLGADAAPSSPMTSTADASIM